MQIGKGCLHAIRTEKSVICGIGGFPVSSHVGNDAGTTQRRYVFHKRNIPHPMLGHAVGDLETKAGGFVTDGSDRQTGTVKITLQKE
jgi:hypothetical protein